MNEASSILELTEQLYGDRIVIVEDLDALDPQEAEKILDYSL